MSRSYAKAGGGGSSHLDSESSFRSSCVPWFSRGLVLLAPRRKNSFWASRMRVALRYVRCTSRLSTSGPASPRRRARPSGRPAPWTRAAGPGPLPVFQHLPSLQAAHDAPSSLHGPISTRLLLSFNARVAQHRPSTPHGTVCLFVCATIEPLDGVRRTGRERRRIEVRQAGRAFAKQPWAAYLSWQLSH